ncbi:MAG: aspartate-semialdehyde dehydrogenase [Archangium sp.]|nr:aspartate-semialdehyde dehydrogenase [Archangium sp.]
MRIAVIGATGVVGQQVLALLAQRDDIDGEQLRLVATEASAGAEVDFGEDVLPVEAIGPRTFQGVHAAILAVPPSAARTLASQAQQSGAWAVDCSGAFRVDTTVPLVSPGLNDTVLDRPFAGRVVSLAAPVTQGLAEVLEPLRVQYGLVLADATVLLGAATLGRAGVERFSRQTAELLNGKEPDIEIFPHRLGFNLIPAVGDFDDRGRSQAERTLLVEAARLWEGTAMPALTATALFVPTYHAAMVVISAHLKRPLDVETLRAVLKAQAGLKVIDDPGSNVYPMPMLNTDDPAVHVGRIRAFGEHVQLVFTVDPVVRMADAAIDVALELAARSVE